MKLFDFDDAVRAEGYVCFCGVDEAGRGPLAGPVFAAAAVLKPEYRCERLNDSKKLSEKTRELLFDEITVNCVSYCIATATVAEIDALNILQATFLAMRRAVAGLAVLPELALVDGNSSPLLPIFERTIIGGDGLSASVAAASVLAKVARDRHMRELDAQYPQYAFARHKGYGTKLHYERLAAFGPAPCHRRTFLRKWVSSREA